ncbi:MAG TPA: PQQ-binding-like beta-propeller repeat protein [Lacipirellulaceae bacterium]|nr:PQQ-binding-like beta-propeller repeat protein [Lacipirellulaceae bacterium]
MIKQITRFAFVVFVGIGAYTVIAADSSDNSATPNADWNQWGGSPQRNNTPVGHNVPTEWEIGEFDYRTGEWDSSTAKNIKWVARLGSQTYGNPVVAGGKIFVGTNNGGGWLKRYPGSGQEAVDLGCLLAFDISDGKFLWQHSSEKLPTGRVHDWPEQGVCSAAYVDGDRVYYVTNRGEVRCVDTEGFHDGENDGEVKDEEEFAKARADVANAPYDMKEEADVVWSYDMMKEMGVSQHNMASCSLTGVGDLLFVCTSNGVDYEHNYIPAADAPSFFVMNKDTKDILWTDKSPGLNILHGQWSSPAYGEFNGVAQVLFAGGDGWLYSFAPEGDGKGNGKLLWKFDCNPKTSFYTVSGKATRNHLIGTPVVYEGLVYVAVGEDPEHGEGVGHLWCIDPSKFVDGRDVSPELAFNSKDPNTPIAHKRLQAVVEEEGDFARANPNTAAVWHYSQVDRNGNGKMEFEETMHRTVGSVVIKDDILYIADFSGLFHCLDAKTGKPHWTYDMLSATWGSPLVVDGKVYIGDEDGDVAIFRHSADPKVAMKGEEGDMTPHYGEINMGNSVYSTPIVAGNVLYIANKSHLFAIVNQSE